LRAARVRLVKDLGRDLPPVHGDPNQLQQVVTNLLANARDALETTGGTVTVRTEPADGGKTVMISVADDGPGIPAENLSKIFGSFFTTKPEGKGTGLGLAITQAIVQDHGGRIDVQSRPQQATVFRVFLPVHGARQEEAPGIENLPRAA
jgi:two-component system NtrC family sensor kinase